MNNISQKQNELTEQLDKNPIYSFLKVLVFYGLLFAFWVGLFLNNDGPGGVEFQHLVLMGIGHTFLVLLHALAIFKPEQKKNQ